MDEYVCSIWDLPSKLYRVHYAGSRTAFSSQQGFVASDTTKNFRSGELDECRRAIEKQFTWSCQDPLPFISLFSDTRHAEDWGRKEPWRGQQGPIETGLSTLLIRSSFGKRLTSLDSAT
jgi:hypothetical protein